MANKPGVRVKLAGWILGSALAAGALIGCSVQTGSWVGQGDCKDLFENASSDAWMGCDFHSQDLSAIDFTSASFLVLSHFYRADLEGSKMSGMALYDNDFELSNLSNEDMSNVLLDGGSLSGANMSGSDLTGARLWRVDAGGVDLSGAVLRETSFDRGTNLRNADFSGADLRGASFRNVYLAGANFSDADLTGVYGVLNKYLIENAFDRPVVFCRTIMPDGSINSDGC